MSIAYKISEFNRRRKWSLFLEEISPNERMRVLDVGFSEKEFSANDNFIEKNYPFQGMLTALSIEMPDEFKRRYPKVKAVHYDGTHFPFEEKEFDICWSNAVVEHVGNQDQQIHFLKEIVRVSKKAFITTPNKYFPIEVHTRTPLIHYLPKGIFDKYLTLIGKKWATGNYMNLLSVSEIENLLDKAGITRYKLLRNRFLGLTLDFVIIINSYR